MFAQNVTRLWYSELVNTESFLVVLNSRNVMACGILTVLLQNPGIVFSMMKILMQ